MSTETFNPDTKVSIPVKFENINGENPKLECSFPHWMNIAFFYEHGEQVKMQVGDLIVNINPKTIIKIMFLFVSEKDIESIVNKLKLIR